MVHICLPALLGVATLFSSVNAAATLAKRADDSLFDPETKKPDAKDVIEYFKDMGDEGDTFDHSFMTSVYSIVLQEPERIEKLFTEKGDRGYEMHCYDPVDRGLNSITRDFGMMKNWKGELATPETEDLTAAFKDHWWVAALHGWLKEVWAEYYEQYPFFLVDPDIVPTDWKTSDENYYRYEDRHQEWRAVATEMIPTEKGQKYESIFESWVRMKTTPYQFGNADLKATHWIMSVLTKRSIAIKYYAVEDDDVIFARDYKLSADDLGNIIDKSPTVWLGSLSPVEDNSLERWTDLTMPIDGAPDPNLCKRTAWQDSYAAHIRSHLGNYVVKDVDAEGNPTLVNPGAEGKEETTKKDDHVYFWKFNGDQRTRPDPPAIQVLFLKDTEEEWESDWFDNDVPEWEAFAVDADEGDCESLFQYNQYYGYLPPSV